MSKKVLIAGESWMSYTTHVKGFDTFYTSTYEEGVKYIKDSIEKSGYEVTYIPNHLAAEKFPKTMEELKNYACVILSDIGSNTLLLHPDTFTKGKITPNRCDLIKQYVIEGGAFLMVGGYMSFTGIDCKARYGETSVKDILPVDCLKVDDRSENPEGIIPVTIEKNHEALKDVPENWPFLLGYNRTVINKNGKVLVKVGEDPLIAVGDFGKGRSGVFTSDCAPHWGSPKFVSWEGYTPVWKGLLDYLTRA